MVKTVKHCYLNWDEVQISFYDQTYSGVFVCIDSVYCFSFSHSSLKLLDQFQLKHEAFNREWVSHKKTMKGTKNV